MKIDNLEIKNYILDFKSRENILINCSHCNNEIFKTKQQIQIALKRNMLLFCNKKCSNNNKKTGKIYNCENCNKEIYKTFSQLKSNIFCSNTCSASKLNKNRKGIKYNLSIEGLENLKESGRRLGLKRSDNKYKEYLEKIKLYKLSPKRCLFCNNILKYYHYDRKYCNKNCQLSFQNNNKDERKQYFSKCKFNFSLNDFPDEFDFQLIEKYGWYSPSNSKNPNLKGVSRDHIVSITTGFKNKIDSKLISHPANCKLLVHTDNQSKGFKSLITVEELIEKINNWNIKYGDVTDKECANPAS